MESMDERRIWQRVRGDREPDRTEQLRACLEEQGRLLAVYRNLSRRGGRFRQLLEQKEHQIACLRGLLRIRTGQSTALPRSGEVRPDLMRCFAGEQKFLQELTQWSGDEDLGPVYAAMARRQGTQCRLLLEILGTT